MNRCKHESTPISRDKGLWENTHLFSFIHLFKFFSRSQFILLSWSRERRRYLSPNIQIQESPNLSRSDGTSDNQEHRCDQHSGKTRSLFESLPTADCPSGILFTGLDETEYGGSDHCRWLSPSSGDVVAVGESSEPVRVRETASIHRRVRD